ncbi:MAG: GIY-YIG nuclease family protein [bacterium]|nr:GIY-YIG nuclease family protein [bacterium]
MKKYYIYILTNYDNTILYVGVTNDLIKRAYEHKNKFVESFTKRYNLNKLVYFEDCTDSIAAIEREKQLKAGSRRKKIELIEKENPNFDDLYEQLI